MKFRFLILAVSFLFISGNGLSAQETSPRAPVVLEITLPSKAMEELHIQDVISKAIQLELERAGMEVIPIFEVLDLPVGSVIEESQDVDIGEAFDLAGSLGADYVLFCIYSPYENEIRLDCTFNDVRKRSLAAIASKSRRMGLTLDVVVTECIQEIVDKMGESLTDLPPREEKVEVVERPGAEPEEAVMQIEHEDKAEPEIFAKRFEFTVGFAPFLAVGEATDFFKVGLSPSFYGGYWFNLPFGYIGLGLYAAIHLFQVEEAEGASQSYLLPAGLDVRYETKQLRPLSVYTRLSGGPAILTLSIDERGPLSKLIYYALGGVGINVPLTRTIGFSIDSSYIMFIGEQNLIMGFSPSANLMLRF